MEEGIGSLGCEGRVVTCAPCERCYQHPALGWHCLMPGQSWTCIKGKSLRQHLSPPASRVTCSSVEPGKGPGGTLGAGALGRENPWVEAEDSLEGRQGEKWIWQGSFCWKGEGGLGEGKGLASFWSCKKFIWSYGVPRLKLFACLL